MLNVIHKMFEDYIENFSDYHDQDRIIIVDNEISIRKFELELVEFWKDWFKITYNLYNKAIQIDIYSDNEYTLEYIVNDLSATYFKNKDNIKKELVLIIEERKQKSEEKLRKLKILLLNLKNNENSGILNKRGR